MGLVMKKPASPITLRAALVCTLCVLVVSVGALVICEVRARADFAGKRLIIDAVVGRAIVDIRRDVEEAWVHDARDNPSLAEFLRNLPVDAPFLGGRVTYEESHLYDYWRQSYSCKIILSAPSPTDRDLSRFPTPSYGDSLVDRVSVEVTFSRRMGSLSRQTPIQIVANPAPDNTLLIDRLKAGFAERKVPYEVLQRTGAELEQ